jgi:rRNA-processing protein FCF1
MGRRKDKWIKKTLNFYRFVFKFDSPYKVIIDGNFAAMALNKKFEMKSSLEKFLDEKVILIIPSCIFKEVQSIESKIPGLLKLLSQYKIEQCKHNLLTPTNCIRDYIGKKNNSKYFVATQDNFLRVQLRKIPGVPLIFFEQNMLLMDKPSRISIEASERREIIRILTEFTKQVRPHVRDILESYQFMAQIDLIRAKAELAKLFNAFEPEVTEQPCIDWIRAVHPLLALSLSRQDKAVVPLDIILSADQRLLIISGPNAGGKSVCLKTVGLLQYMLQCGLLVQHLSWFLDIRHPVPLCPAACLFFQVARTDRRVTTGLSDHSPFCTGYCAQCQVMD